MRKFIDIVTESIHLLWGHGTAGCWVLPDGSVKPCDYEADIHHGDIAYGSFDIDSDDPDEIDEFVSVGIEHGWLRMRMTEEDFTVEFNPKLITNVQIRTIPKLEDGNHSRYTFEYQGNHQTFSTIGKMILAIKELINR